MQTHPSQTHPDPSGSNPASFSNLDPAQTACQQNNQWEENQVVDQKKRTAINVPARALLDALKVHYQVSCQSLAKLGITEGKLNENAYIRSILSQSMNTIFDILASCEPCAEHVQKVLIDDLDIEDIPHQFILETIRLKAELLFDLEQQTSQCW